MSRWIVALHTGSQMLINVHRGAVLPEGRVIVIVVPLAAALFYLLVVRRNGGR